MDKSQRLYERFLKLRKFPTGNKVKKTGELLKGKNKLLAGVSSSSEGKGNKPRRRNCCHY